jgi:hypothetical protein
MCTSNPEPGLRCQYAVLGRAHQLRIDRLGHQPTRGQSDPVHAAEVLKDWFGEKVLVPG